MLDFMIVGSGFYGSVLARELKDAGFSVQVIEKRNHIGGNCYTENIRGIHVHKYGAHYFHTNKKDVWKYVNQYADFSTYSPRVKVSHNNQLYSFPINLLTLHQIYNVRTPEEAQAIIEKEKVHIPNPTNLEEYILSKVGRKIYEIFYEGYSTKQWGLHPSKIPSSIAKRIPIRFTLNDCYYDDLYQGTPIDGYAELFNNLLSNIDVALNVDFNSLKSTWRTQAKKLIYSGCIDEFFDYCYGRLEYRSLRHESEIIENCDFQGAIQINYTDLTTPFTRIVEHKHFSPSTPPHTIITREFPADFKGNNDPFYPINDIENQIKYQKYKTLLEEEEDIIIGGRLGSYKYLDMDDVIQMALIQSRKLC